VRLKDIERGNALMLQTLNAVIHVGVSFRELKQRVHLPLSPSSLSSSHAADAEMRRGTDGRAAADRDSIEPLMRELQEAARFNLESQREIKLELGEDDDEDIF
jgi:hypothetical protein